VTPLVFMLCRYWGLNDVQARRWWQAVGRARWSVAQEWRRRVLLFGQGIASTLATPQTVDAIQKFLDTSASPAQVLGVVESLVQEGQLSRQDARCIENKVLAMVDRCGRWR